MDNNIINSGQLILYINYYYDSRENKDIKLKSIIQALKANTNEKNILIFSSCIEDFSSKHANYAMYNSKTFRILVIIGMIIGLDPDIFINPDIHWDEYQRKRLPHYIKTFLPKAIEEIKKFYPVIFDRQEKRFPRHLQKHIRTFMYGDEESTNKYIGGIPHPKSPRMGFKSPSKKAPLKKIKGKPKRSK